ncbi:unnamed protein product [Nippostrongylus brasiliensis]|uniref:Peptidase_M13_N domain-containing protein n=1 Tax=Nippostrongylus brasiliensis TaxID=27835 RepID=A0A0N4Y7L7_NIPBR|nr:unnamed protein product [Nippostrongylus brasiliensis]
MSKLLSFTAFTVLAAVALAIASLVLNIIILTKVNNINTENNNGTTPTPTPASPQYCPNIGPSNNSTAWTQAAAYLLNGLDQSVDPCQDFYAFTCNKFLASVNLTALGQSRLGTYDQAQVDVNAQIAKALQSTRCVCGQCELGALPGRLKTNPRGIDKMVKIAPFIMLMLCCSVKRDY